MISMCDEYKRYVWMVDSLQDAIALFTEYENKDDLANKFFERACVAGDFAEFDYDSYIDADEQGNLDTADMWFTEYRRDSMERDMYVDLGLALTSHDRFTFIYPLTWLAQLAAKDKNR